MAHHYRHPKTNTLVYGYPSLPVYGSFGGGGHAMAPVPMMPPIMVQGGPSTPQPHPSTSVAGGGNVSAPVMSSGTGGFGVGPSSAGPGTGGGSI
jgi:hypothetical protein